MFVSPLNILNKEKITLTKVDTVSENHKGNFIEINIYRLDNRFSFEYKMKIEKIIKQKTPHEKDFIFLSKHKALKAAKKEVKENCKQSRKAKHLIEDFTVVNYNQLELF